MRVYCQVREREAFDALAGPPPTDQGADGHRLPRVCHDRDPVRGVSSAHARAYFITGDEQFAGRARESFAAFDVARRKLSDLTIDNPVQGRLIARLVVLEASRTERIVRGMERFESGTLRWDKLAGAEWKTP